MPRKREIDRHPKKDQIIKALVRGDAYRDIAGRYGVSKAALSRYLRDKLLPQTARVAYEKGIRDGSLAFDQITRAIERVNKMYRACDEYLAHPDKPGEYFLGPRAAEVTISYREIDPEGNWQLRSCRLQNALDRLTKAGMIPVSYRYQHTDPRKLVLDTMSKATEQLEFLAKVEGKLQDIVVNIETVEQWAQIKIAIIGALENVPDAKTAVVEALRDLVRTGSD